MTYALVLSLHLFMLQIDYVSQTQVYRKASQTTHVLQREHQGSNFQIK